MSWTLTNMQLNHKHTGCRQKDGLQENSKIFDQVAIQRYKGEKWGFTQVVDALGTCARHQVIAQISTQYTHCSSASKQEFYHIPSKDYFLGTPCRSKQQFCFNTAANIYVSANTFDGTYSICNFCGCRILVFLNNNIFLYFARYF